MVFSEPVFDAEVIDAYVGTEVDLDVFEQHVVIYDVWESTEQVLGAAKVAVTQVNYDAVDFPLHVQRLESEIERLQSGLSSANRINQKGRATVEELLRRAEIKAGASERHRERQAAAIEVLKRLQSHFDD